MTKEQNNRSREEVIENILSDFVKLGLCEPRTEEERQEVEERRQKMGAENFDRAARENYICVMAFIAAIKDEEKQEGAVL